MKSFFVETSAIINYLRAEKQTVKIIDSLNGNITSSYICFAELSEGLHRITNRSEQEAAVQTFFGSLDKIYGVDLEIADKFGELRAHLKKRGKIIEDLDLLIAATCLVYDLELFTFNQKHFLTIPELRIFNYGK